MSVHKYSYDASWTVKFKGKTVRGFKTKKEAELFEAKLLTGDNKAIGRGITFEKVYSDYLEKQKLHNSYGTVQKRENIYKEIIKPHFPIYSKVENITKKDCRDFYEWLYHTDYASSYKNIILNQLVAIFKHCERYFDIENNPAKSLEKFKLTFNEKQSKRAIQFNVWSIDEFNSFIQYVDNDTYKLFLIVLYYTGMRKGEAMALKWSDFRNGIFDINKSITTKTKNVGYEIKEPKNIYSNRRISAGKTITQIMNQYKEREMSIAGFSEDWFIFGRLKPISTTNLDRVKKIAIEKSGVKTIRIHDLRHSHASNLFAQGIDYITISKRLGHNNPQTTLNIYAHLLDSSVDVVNDYVSQSSQNLLNIFPTKH